MGKRNIKRIFAHIKRKNGLGREENDLICRIKEDFRKRTADTPDSWELGDFLQLLRLAEYGNMGKSNAIIFAFKIGYKTGREELKNFVISSFEKGGAIA